LPLASFLSVASAAATLGKVFPGPRRNDEGFCFCAATQMRCVSCRNCLHSSTLLSPSLLPPARLGLTLPRTTPTRFTARGPSFPNPALCFTNSRQQQSVVASSSPHAAHDMTSHDKTAERAPRPMLHRLPLAPPPSHQHGMAWHGIGALDAIKVRMPLKSPFLPGAHAFDRRPVILPLTLPMALGN